MVQESAPLTAPAALAKNGSDASHDALLAEFERARRDKSDWPLRYKLKPLSRYAKQTPHWEALEQSVLDELARHDGKKRPGSVAQRLGLNVPSFKFSLMLHGRARGRKEPLMLWLQGDDKNPNLKTEVVASGLKPSDDLTQLAAWLARATKAEPITWAWGSAKLATNLRGKHRDAIMAWLKGERAVPAPD